MTKAELIEALKDYDDNCEITISGEPLTEFFDVEKIETEKPKWNRVYLMADPSLLYSKEILKDIIKYVFENEPNRLDNEERRTLEELINLWE